MGSALKTREEAIIPLTPAADYSAKRGYTVTVSGETATLSSSATVPAKGVILEPNRTSAGYATEQVTVGILGGFAGSVLMKTSGAITKGDLVQQAADGTIVTDAGTGARTVIGVALDTGVSGDLISVAPFAPQIRS